ncbi:Exodeoxyribonuclease VII small subunit [Bryocella elongata]|uniref:Exodeoxyribonuclease 7 small subunit n=1 Tax=Bryocella elongata TaxID=863522 RepID=A0A1H5SBG1_9BACT|nr:exodeoxyribonuclease VII small subunit [Bryocella elongata]SEF48003.1 Exodeoxyribonuclease VII small subunit [Bryocella elongata]
MAGAKVTFEQQLADLEKVVEQLERGDLPLEESVGLFERGMALSNACRGQLASAESRIQVLLNPTENGPVEVEDLAMAVAEGEGDVEEDEYADDDDSDVDNE